MAFSGLRVDEQSTYVDVYCDGFLFNLNNTTGTYNIGYIYDLTKTTIYYGLGRYLDLSTVNHGFGYVTGRLIKVLESSPNKVHIRVWGRHETTGGTPLTTNTYTIMDFYVYPDRFTWSVLLFIDSTITLDALSSGNNQRLINLDISQDNVTNEVAAWEASGSESSSTNSGTLTDTDYVATPNDEMSLQSIVLWWGSAGGTAVVVQKSDDLAGTILTPHNGTLTAGNHILVTMHIIDSAVRQGSAQIYNSTDRLAMGRQYKDLEIRKAGGAGGSRVFDDASSQYLTREFSTLPITTTPFTFACFCKATDLDADQTLFDVGQSASDSNRWMLRLENPESTLKAWSKEGAGTWYGSSGAAISAGVWKHVCGVWTSSTSRQAYVDGTPDTAGTDSSAPAPAGTASVTLAARRGAAVSQYFGGKMAHAAWWNVALTAAEVAELAAGANPKTIRPESLVAYWPLVDDDEDAVGGYDMTPYNSPTWSTTDFPGTVVAVGGSRVFDDGSSQYLESATPITAMPLTMACWFTREENYTDTARALMSITDKDAAQHEGFSLLVDEGDPTNYDLQAACGDGGVNGVALSTTYVQNGVWHHACGVFTSTTSRDVYLDGGGKGSNTTSCAPANFDTCNIAAWVVNSAYAKYWTGKIAHAAIWNVALTDAEVARLANGALPTEIRPEALVAYWKLVDDDNDPIGGYDMTPYNSPTWSTTDFPDVWEPDIGKWEIQNMIVISESGFQADGAWHIISQTPYGYLKKPPTDNDDLKTAPDVDATAAGGSRVFDDASSQYLKYGSPVISGGTPPFSIAAWFKSDQATLEQQIVSMSDEATNNEEQALLLNAGNVLAKSRIGGSSYSGTSTTTYNTGVWNHACGVWASTSSRKAYLNGGGEGTSGTTAAPSGLDNTVIGARVRSTVGSPMSGSLAHVAVWNVALTAAEVAELAAGANPKTIRPEALVAYWKLVDDDNDPIGGYDMTPYNSPTWSTTDFPDVDVSGGIAYGLKASWLFNEKTGTNVYAHQDSNYNGVFVDENSDGYPRWCKEGIESVSSTDYNRYINVTSNPQTPSAFTVITKVRFANDGHHKMISRHAYHATGGPYGWTFTRIATNDYFRLEFSVNGTTWVNASGPNNSCPINEWMTLACTFRSGSQIVYKNGVAVGSNTISGTVYNHVDQQFMLLFSGYQLGGNLEEEAFYGKMEYIYFWDRVLSPEEIRFVTNNPYWMFGDGGNAKVTIDRTQIRPATVIEEWPFQIGPVDNPVDTLLNFLKMDDNAANNTLKAEVGPDGTWHAVSDDSARNTSLDSVSGLNFRGRALDTQDGTGYGKFAVGSGKVHNNAFFLKGSVLIKITPQFLYTETGNDQFVFILRYDATNYIYWQYELDTNDWEVSANWGGTGITKNFMAYAENYSLQRPTVLLLSWDSGKDLVLAAVDGIVRDFAINAGTPTSSDPAQFYLGAGYPASGSTGDLIIDEVKTFSECILPFGAFYIGNGEGLLADIDNPHADLTWFFDGQAAAAKGGSNLASDKDPTNSGGSFVTTDPLIGTKHWDSNGTGNYLSRAESSEDIVDYNNGFIAGWFNVQTITNGTFIFDVRDADGSDRISAQVVTGGYINVTYRSNSTDEAITGNIAITAGKWFFLRVTWDDNGGDKKVHSFINGIENGTPQTIANVWGGGTGLTWKFTVDYNNANGCDAFVQTIWMGKKADVPQIWTAFGKPLHIPRINLT